jgi:primase-polymerase (primpol)-like protein
MIAPAFEAMPEELRHLPRWVCWRNEEGKKIPYDSKCVNSKASSTNPGTWSSFEQSQTAFCEREGEKDAYSGVGIVLDGDGLVGVDINHCVNEGKPDPAATDCADSLHVLRGGSWNNSPTGLRSAERRTSNGTDRNMRGFRLARTLFTP